ITVHDLRRFHFPETYPRLRGLFLDKMIPRSIEQATKIIAVSEFTKQDILKLFGIESEKVQVVHSGIDSHRFSTPASSARKEQIRRQYLLPELYILAVGHLEPRKNYAQLIEAYASMRAQKRISHHLVIVGQENWHYQNLYRRIKQLNLDSHVHFLGFVDFHDLPQIYQMASLFVAPSLFEGFSFTPLEAMAAGIPVAVSNTASHPEVCSDAAAYFDPYDVENMADTLLRLLDDSQFRQRLVHMGKKNILRFTWEKCIDETFKIYEELLNKI
ncbi:MAG: glycosyltransferase family 1 protein, partial [Calditrichaeota bacterium]